MGYHFGSKADLLVAAFEQLCDGYREMLGMLSETADPVEAASKRSGAAEKLCLAGAFQGETVCLLRFLGHGEDGRQTQGGEPGNLR